MYICACWAQWRATQTCVLRVWEQVTYVIGMVVWQAWLPDNVRIFSRFDKWSSPDRLRHGKMRVRQATFRDNFYLVLRPTRTICCVHCLLHATERDACIDCDDSVLPQQKREVETSYMAAAKYQSWGKILDTASKLTRSNFTDNAPKYKILLLTCFFEVPNIAASSILTLFQHLVRIDLKTSRYFRVISLPPIKKL